MNKADIQKMIEALRAQSKPLEAERDRRNALNVDLQAELDKQNAIAEAARLRAAALADQIEANWGRGEWVDLKKRIGRIANQIMVLKQTAKEL